MVMESLRQYSITRPAVRPVIEAQPLPERRGAFSPGGDVLRIQAPLPVTVQVAENGRWFPYPRGKRNSFSALPKWLEVTASIYSPYPAATLIDANANASPDVEHAP